MAVSIEQMRQTAASIVTHMHNDPHFKKQLRNDPQAALTDAGLPARITYSVAQEQKQNGFEAVLFLLLCNTVCYPGRQPGISQSRLRIVAKLLFEMGIVVHMSDNARRSLTHLFNRYGHEKSPSHW